MTEFFQGDIVRVEMPRGYSMRGVLGISLMFTTHPEAKFEGAIGTITEVNPIGPQSVHQYLVDFRTHDNSRVGIPWQAQWFREEWLSLVERPALVTAAAGKTAPEATWPERPEPAETGSGGGIAHPDAKIFHEGKTDFLPPGLGPDDVKGTVPPSALGFAHREDAESAAGDAGSIAHPEARIFKEGIKDFQPSGGEAAGETAIPFTGADRDDDRSAADIAAFEPTPESMSGPVDATTPGSVDEALIVERGAGFVRVQGMSVCPDGFPIKGNANSGIYHLPTDHSYRATIPEICFSTEEAALENGFRAAKRH